MPDSILEKSNKVESLFYPTRKEVNLFNLENVKNYIKDIGPDVIVNAAAKVGGIYANNTYRTDFILENLKINSQLSGLKALIDSNGLGGFYCVEAKKI